jgi:hypothetical protein
MTEFLNINKNKRSIEDLLFMSAGILETLGNVLMVSITPCGLQIN